MHWFNYMYFDHRHRQLLATTVYMFNKKVILSMIIVCNDISEFRKEQNLANTKENQLKFITIVKKNLSWSKWMEWSVQHLGQSKWCCYMYILQQNVAVSVTLVFCTCIVLWCEVNTCTYIFFPENTLLINFTKCYIYHWLNILSKSFIHI